MGQHLIWRGGNLSSLLDERFHFTKEDVFGCRVTPAVNYDRSMVTLYVCCFHEFLQWLQVILVSTGSHLCN